jgi:conjugal transfer/entry exclusion protein
LAVGLDYLDACPVRGFRRGGSGESMGVEVWVNESLVQEESSLADPGALLRPADARALAAQRQHQRLIQQQQQQQQQQQALLIR